MSDDSIPLVGLWRLLGSEKVQSSGKYRKIILYHIIFSSNKKRRKKEKRTRDKEIKGERKT